MGPTPRASVSVGLGWGLRMCTFPGDADDAGLRTSLEKLMVWLLPNEANWKVQSARFFVHILTNGQSVYLLALTEPAVYALALLMLFKVERKRVLSYMASV